MIHALDRVTIAASRPPDAARAYETLLGRRARDENGGASNQLSNVRLDLVADCSHSPGLTALAFAVADLDGCERLLSRRGLPVQRPTNLASACLLADRSGNLRRADRNLPAAARPRGAVVAGRTRRRGDRT